MNQLFEEPGYYRIRILPNQSQSEIRDVMDDGTIKIAIAAVPEKGKANKELIRFISEISGHSKQAISIASGLTSRIKVIHIESAEGGR